MNNIAMIFKWNITWGTKDYSHKGKNEYPIIPIKNQK